MSQCSSCGHDMPPHVSLFFLFCFFLSFYTKLWLSSGPHQWSSVTLFLCCMFKPAAASVWSRNVAHQSCHPAVAMDQYNKVVQTLSLMVKVLAACLGQMLAFSTDCSSFSSANSKKTKKKACFRETTVISLEFFKAAVSDFRDNSSTDVK